MPLTDLPLTDIEVWISAALLLLAVGILLLLTRLADRLDRHDEDLDRLLAAVAKRKDTCP